MRLQPGAALGPYVIVEPLGSGGMGEVYRGRDPRLGRDVAIKVLSASPDAERLSRFEREARATAVLAHPNIVTVFDVGTHEGVPFLVSELLDGQTLRQRVSGGPLPVHDAVDLAIHLARAVAAAHALRIVHRDLKPENIVITRSGILKVLDFGLAKLRADTPALSEAPTVYRSQPGLLIGTPAYMAPEQLRGEPVDERADIFAIGTILAEMIGGVNPFQRRTPAETLAAILREPPRLDEASMPEGVRQIILRCLQKNRSDRFEAASDLAFALELVRGSSGAASIDRSPDARPGTSIAVLPFADMSPGRDQDYLCEGLAEELINVLTQIEGLRVAARSSSFQFPSSSTDVRAIGTRLGVTTVLEGGVRRLGDRLRVTVRLVDVSDGYQRWSHRYDAGVEDLFAIQDEIAASVATALRGMLTARERDALRRPDTGIDCYEYFLRGRQLFRRTSKVNLEAAKEMFDQAIRIDPSYAPAYAGLADVHAWLFEWAGGRQSDYEAAETASRRALELAPRLAEAHSSRGYALSLRGRYDEASVEFDEAIRINPSSFDAYYLYGRSCFAAGRIERSAELFERAAEVRLEDFQALLLGGQSLLAVGREEEGLRMSSEGVKRAERQLELDPADLRALSLGAGSLHRLGQTERAHAWIRRALELGPDDYSVLVNAACLYATSGMKDAALDLLERAFAAGWGKRDWVEHDPDYDSLRGDPRFESLLARLP
jgi:serine/threonine protein kinase/tetratricopeptide (TPR) repeat protein